MRREHRTNYDRARQKWGRNGNTKTRNGACPRYSLTPLIPRYLFGESSCSLGSNGAGERLVEGYDLVVAGKE